MDDWRCLRISVGYSRLSVRVAGEVGFEPTNGGSKGRCLTTWRLPTKLLSLILKRYAQTIPRRLERALVSPALAPAIIAPAIIAPAIIAPAIIAPAIIAPAII